MQKKKVLKTYTIVVKGTSESWDKTTSLEYLSDGVIKSALASIKENFRCKVTLNGQEVKNKNRFY